SLEQIPEELVVDFVVELHLLRFHNRAEGPRTAIRGRALHFRITGLDVGAQECGGPLGLLKVFDGRVDVVREIAFGGPQVLDFGDIAVKAGFEDGVHHHVRVGVRRNGTHFGAHAAFIADGDAHHGAAVRGRSVELIRGFEVRVEAAVGVHAGIDEQADIVAVGEDAVDKVPAEFAEFLLATGIPEKVFAVLADGNVGVHAAAVHANNGLGQEAGGEAHVRGDLTAN